MRKSLFCIWAFLLCAFNLMAQTSNEGILVISENTKFSSVTSLDNRSGAELYNDGDAFIYHHFNNDGIVDFHQQTGLTRFIGNQAQKLEGNQISYFYNILFDNGSLSAPFQLSGEFDISGSADFSRGIVDNDNFGGGLNFAENGSHLNTSDKSHVDGTVFKTGPTAFTFPIGDGGFYRMAAMSDPVSRTSAYRAKFYFENSNTLYPHQLREDIIKEADNQEYWVVEKETNNDEDVLITLSWDDKTTPQAMKDAAEQGGLTIVGWDETSNMWKNEGGVIDKDSQTVTTAVSGYGVFTFGRLDKDLAAPCELVIYNAITPNGDGINDFLFIDQGGAQCARKLHVQVFNRWGVKVFESEDYGVNGDVFNGFSSGRLTINDSNQLPSGTYYYILNFEYGSTSEKNKHKQAGFLYLSGN